jgi:hypothetical protein
MSTQRFYLPNNVPYPQDDDDDESQSFADLISHFQNGGNDLEQILQNERRNLVVDDSIKNVNFICIPSNIFQIGKVNFFCNN